MESTKRKRSRLACGPCRERKRKCNGREPCITCTEWGYGCYFEAPRKQATLEPVKRPTSVPNDGEPDDSGLARRLEANSGAAFVRKLGLKIDPTKAPKLNLFGWNTGTRQLSSQSDVALALPITDITSLEHMKSLAQVYFEKVDPCYGFVGSRQFYERLDTRWNLPLTSTTYDSVLGGVAALGCLFSQRTATITELHLVSLARSVLEGHHLAGPPSVDFVTGWLLRLVYRRMTDSPHSVWLAGSTLMHLVEASGLHPESPSGLLPSADCETDLQRRLVGVVHHLNAWTSFDLGLSRVLFQKNDLPLLPTLRPGDYTVELLGLLPASVSLDPGNDVDLIEILREVLKGTHTQPPSVLAQTNLVLCILRRLHHQNIDISSDLTDHVLVLLENAVNCARQLAIECCPWHHVANVPFHIICVLLVLDTRSSLAILPEAMRCLSLVASLYDTETMRTACSTACLLVLLHQQRRKDDIAIFDETLKAHQQQWQSTSTPEIDPSAEDHSWLGELVADLPGLQRDDLEQFLNADMTDHPSFLSESL